MISDDDKPGPLVISEIHQYADTAGRRVDECRPLNHREPTRFIGFAALNGTAPNGQKAKLPFQFVINAMTIAEAYEKFDTDAELGGKQAAAQLNTPKIITPRIVLPRPPGTPNRLKEL